MRQTLKIDVLAWQKRHAYRYAVVNDKYKNANSPNKSMLEDITISPVALIAGTLAATTIAIPAGLSFLSEWSQKNSAPIVDESDAHNHFQRVLSHYNQEASKLELRCCYDGGNYVKKVGEKYVVFINLKAKPKKASIQHEILHVVSGDTKYDPEYGTIFHQAKNWALYFCYLEPRIIIRTKRELLG